MEKYEIKLLIIILIQFSVCLLFSVAINSLLLKFSKTLGIRNHKDTIIRWSSESKPALGGISFFIIFLFSIISTAFIDSKNEIFLNYRYIGIILACTIGFIMGLYDDAYNTNVKIKLLSQITAGIILILTGTYIYISEYSIINYGITLFWVIGIMNSINMLDNMDGIATLVSINILLIIICSELIRFAYFDPIMILLIGVLASLVGFLFFNWNPSKMFMGDTGSQFLGVLLASIGILYFWNSGFNENNVVPSKNFITVIIAFALPIIDTTTVTIKRLLKKSSPFVGGKDHTTHHLSYLGFSDRQVALTFLGLSLISLILTVVILNYLNNWKLWHSVVFISVFLLEFSVLFYISNRNKAAYENK